MRVGFNPNKDKKLEPASYWHQVVIPVYISSADNYFTDGLRILKASIESLVLTSHKKTFITVVNNGSNKETSQYLDKLLDDGCIHELIHTYNIGKINAVLKGLAGNNFPLVSIFDADVLFLHGWQEATYKLFNVFPQCGVVCPTPSSRSLKTYTSNIFAEYFFSPKLKVCPVANPKALLKFAQSIGNPNFYNKVQRQYILCIEHFETRAVVGAGHFAATYRREAFESIKSLHQDFALGGDSETLYLDKPVLERGFWRLSTYDNFAFHMGNKWEEWMETEMKVLRQIKNFQTPLCAPEFLHTIKPQTGLWYKWRNKAVGQWMKNKSRLARFLVRKGLPKAAKNDYLT